MLIVLTFRFLTLGLLAVVILDGATATAYGARGWHFALWDGEPDLPAAVFDLLRLAASIVFAWEGWTHTRYSSLGFPGSRGWAVVMVILLALFQPVFPISFPYHWWLWIDLVTLFVLFVHSYIVSKPLLLLMRETIDRGASPINVSQSDAATAVFIGYVRAAAALSGNSLQDKQSGDKPKRKQQPTKFPTPPAPVPPYQQRQEKPPLSDFAPRSDRTPAEKIADLAALKHKIERELAREDLSAARRADLERYLEGVAAMLARAIQSSERR